MQIVDHEEMVEEENDGEDDCILENRGFNPESTGSMVLMDSVKPEARESFQRVMSATAL